MNQPRARVPIPTGHIKQANCNTRVQLGKMSGVKAGDLQQALIGVRVGIKLATIALAMVKGQLGTTWERVGVD